MRLVSWVDLLRHISHRYAHQPDKRVAYIDVYGSETTAVSAGDGAYTMRVPAFLNRMDLTTVEACVFTASTSGAVNIMIHNETDGVDMLSTALTIDANETDSSTAATPAVIDTDHDDVATADLIRIDIDSAGTGTLGLHINLGFRKG